MLIFKTPVPNPCRRVCIRPQYLSHVDLSDGECLVAQNCPVLVLLASLQHHLQSVAVPFQEVGILQQAHDTVSALPALTECSVCDSARN